MGENKEKVVKEELLTMLKEKLKVIQWKYCDNMILWQSAYCESVNILVHLLIWSKSTVKYLGIVTNRHLWHLPFKNSVSISDNHYANVIHWSLYLWKSFKNCPLLSLSIDRDWSLNAKNWPFTVEGEMLLLTESPPNYIQGFPLIVTPLCDNWLLWHFCLVATVSQ